MKNVQYKLTQQTPSIFVTKHTKYHKNKNIYDVASLESNSNEHANDPQVV